MTPVSLRQRLADDTRSAHRALHAHSLLQSLTASDVTLADYTAALSVFLRFHTAIEAERRRIARWHLYALKDWISAIASDLQTPLPDAPPFRLSSRFELLGALYVAHGALLGRSVMRDPVARALPHLPHVYLSRPFPMTKWRALSDLLYRQGRSPECYAEIRSGALQSFDLMTRLLAEKSPAT